jgi:MOSC domain-containing protein YiiM
MAEGRVVALHLKIKGGVRPVDSLFAVAGQGFEADACYGRPKRQALLVATDHLAALGYKPGQLREQIAVDFRGLQELPKNAVIKVGEAELEIVGDCEPCSKMAAHLGEDPQTFIAKTSGRRGMLARVLKGGSIHVGDAVVTVDA